jgi:hypothetical protein
VDDAVVSDICTWLTKIASYLGSNRFFGNSFIFSSRANFGPTLRVPQKRLWLPKTVAKSDNPCQFGTGISPISEPPPPGFRIEV